MFKQKGHGGVGLGLRMSDPDDQLPFPTVAWNGGNGLVPKHSSGGGRREGIGVTVNRLGPAHPGFGPYAADPVGEIREEAGVLAHMLLADQPDRYDAARGDGDRRAEEALQHEDAFGVVAQHPAPEIGDDHLGLVEPTMERQIFARLTNCSWSIRDPRHRAA